MTGPLTPVALLAVGAVAALAMGRFARVGPWVGVGTVALSAAAVTLLALVGPSRFAVPWAPGGPQTALPFVLQADALSVLGLALLLLVGGVTFAGLFVERPGPEAVAFRLLLLAGASVVVLAGSAGLAGAALVIMAFAALEPETDGPAVDAIVPPLLAALAVLGAAVSGVATDAGFVLLLVAVVILCAQYPVTWLATGLVSQGRLVGVVRLAVYSVVGVFLAVRFGVTAAPIWGWQAMALVGAMTALVANILALRHDRLMASLALVATGQFGLVFMALGLGTPDAAVAGLLQWFGATPILAGLLTLAWHVEHHTPNPPPWFARGLAAGMPLTRGMFAALAIVLSVAPILTSSFAGKLLMVGGALADGRWVFALFLVGGSAFGAAATLRVALALFGERAPVPRRRESRWVLAGAGVAGVAGLTLGGFVWTGLDPISRAAIVALGLPRGRPVAGDLLALPLPALIGAVVALALTFLVGVVGALWLMRRPRTTSSRAPERDLAPVPVSPAVSIMPIADRPTLPGFRLPPMPLPDATPVPEPEQASDTLPLGSIIDPRRLLAWLWRVGRGISWLVAGSVGLLEGRYYMAAVLVFGLWIVLIFLG